MPHSELARFDGSSVRVLIVPGLHDSGPAHWQTWLQTQYRGAVRVRQQNWEQPDLDAWAERISAVIEASSPKTTWVAAAHSFGCLALARYLFTRQPPTEEHGGIQAALLVAPADPQKFGVSHRLPTQGLGVPAAVVSSENDPWMPLSRAQEWASRWGARFQNLGPVGHINTESGFGPWPLARFKVDQMIRDQQRQRRLERAHPLELNYAI